VGRNCAGALRCSIVRAASLGLVLSTPLTLCLAVLGRHVLQFDSSTFCSVVSRCLSPELVFTSCFLTGDPEEATDRAEEILKKDYLITFYRDTGIPALTLAERDRARGVLGDQQRQPERAGAKRGG